MPFPFTALRLWSLIFGTVALLLPCSSPILAYDLKDNAILHARKGQLLLERGQAADAVEELKAALLLNPYTSLSASIYNNLGLAYRALGNYPYAFVSFQRACRIHPTFSLYYQNLIDTYTAAGQGKLVERNLLSIVKRNPDNAEAWFMLGLIYKEQDNRTQAKRCFERFLKLEPESEMARAARSAF